MPDRIEWTPVDAATVDGTQCALRFRDALGAYEDIGPFIFHDGCWYRIEPPIKVLARVTHFRPLYADEVANA